MRSPYHLGACGLVNVTSPSARLGSLLPYHKAAEAMAEFLPIKSTESFVILRHRTLKLGERLDERACERAWFEPLSLDVLA